jgi:hypothetical protein
MVSIKLFGRAGHLVSSALLPRVCNASQIEQKHGRVSVSIAPDQFFGFAADFLSATDGSIDGSFGRADLGGHILAKRQIVVLPILAPSMLILAPSTLISPISATARFGVAGDINILAPR